MPNPWTFRGMQQWTVLGSGFGSLLNTDEPRSFVFGSRDPGICLVVFCTRLPPSHVFVLELQLGSIVAQFQLLFGQFTVGSMEGRLLVSLFREDGTYVCFGSLRKSWHIFFDFLAQAGYFRFNVTKHSLTRQLQLSSECIVADATVLS